MSLVTLAVGTALKYKVRRAFGTPPRTIEQVAQRSWTISPGKVEPAVRPFIPDDHLGRIQHGVLGETREDVLNDLNALQLNHRPTRGYLLRDVVLFDRSLYCGMSKLDLFRGLGFRRTLFDEPTEEIESAVWASSYAGTRWYGHFLRDEIVSEELARPLGRMIGHVRPAYPHEPGWRDRLQAPRPSTFGVVQVGELTWIDDVGQHPEKRQRYQTLRGRLAGLPRGHDRILFMRGRKDGEERRMLNEAAVVDRLVQEGFHVIDPSLVEVDEILRRCAGASLIVTVEGSHASPIPYFAREGATVVYLFPPSRVSPHSPRLAGFFGLHGAMFIGEPVDGSRGLFKVDPEELVRTIEQAKAPRWAGAPSGEMRYSSTG